MSMLWMGLALGVLLLATGTIVLVAVRLVQALRVIVHLEQQVVRLQEGTNLLTDTVELGFRQCATELERLAAQTQLARPVGASAAPRPTTARVKAASARGRSVREIAAQEQVSEGEVRLRLSLAEAGARGRKNATPRPPARGRTDAALRA